MHQQHSGDDSERLIFASPPDQPPPLSELPNDSRRSPAPASSDAQTMVTPNSGTQIRSPTAELQSRANVALGMAPSLAVPAELLDLEQSPAEPSSARWEAAEWSVLRRGLDALSIAMGALAGVAVRMEPDGSVAGLNRSQESPRTLAGGDAAALAQLRADSLRRLPLDRARSEFPDLLELLAPATGAGSVLVSPIPIVVGAPLTIALALGVDAPALDSVTPVIMALGAACGAGCQAIRLRRRVAEEAQARDAFISFAAHELRSPITSTKGFAQLLARQARKHPLPDSMLHSIRAIDEQSGRMGDMVGELLDATRIRRGTLDVVHREIDLAPLIEKLVERVNARAEATHVELDLRASPVIGKVDPQRVEQIVRDLLDNAIRFSPESAHILVTVEKVQGTARITVRDEGIGVAPQERERIFEYLYRSPGPQRRNLGGIGLGLYVSRFLAEQMGGSLVLLESSATPPTGSAFRLSLPLASS